METSFPITDYDKELTGFGVKCNMINFWLCECGKLWNLFPWLTSSSSRPGLCVRYSDNLLISHSLILYTHFYPTVLTGQF